MKLKNQEIYNIALKISNIFNSSCFIELPIKINFYFSKNKKLLLELGKEIEDMKSNILLQYGEYNKETEQYIIQPDNIYQAQKELDDLFNLEQEINIYKVNIEDFPKDLKLTPDEMDALMFMIED